jgi:hypothetical protein
MSDFELGVVLGFLIGAIQVGAMVTLLWLTGADERLVAWLERVRDKIEEDPGEPE